MSEDQAATATPQTQLESGTYEIIRNRLRRQADELEQRLQQLNEARKDVFGSVETTLLGTERITTSHNCIPRDMVAVGRCFLFGYNVHFGLKTEMAISDVFAAYEFREGGFHSLPLDLIADERFVKDFKDVYRYYKDAVFARFFSSGPHLFMVFRVGKTADDIKTFKWLIEGESLRYLDNRSDHEVRFPPQHGFDWKRTKRDAQRAGVHPHVSIEDRVFVETIGGDLTIKVENNTDTGAGIYAEPVEHADQTLDDAEIYYAAVGNLITLKIRPYQEQKYRYFVFNEKIQNVVRLDAIEHACVLLPDGHGLIFANGYYLQTGEYKVFEGDFEDMLFERQVSAPNGEDHLFSFYNRLKGVYVLLQYNLIEQQIDTPLVCNGFTFFEAGELACFKAQETPQKHHAIQIWQTPYVGENYVPETQSDSFLYKIGNRDIVRAMAECNELINLIRKDDSYANLYLDLVKESQDVIDTYFWLDRDEAFQLKETLADIHTAAQSAVGEFEKVVRVKRNTREETQRVQTRTHEVLSGAHRKRFDKLQDFVSTLADLRTVRGEIISLRELRYVDADLVERLENEVADDADRFAQRCVDFLLTPNALASYEQRVQEQQEAIESIEKVTDARDLEDDIAAGAEELEMLIDIVSNLKIEDATQRTEIIDSISAIFARINSVRAALKKKTQQLLSVEGIAEFNSQIKLLNQGVVNYLDISDTPERCEEYLTKLMIQLEELEGRFAEFDEFIVQLSEKRNEVYNAFENRKLQLLEARNKRANSLMSAADRILKGIKTRVESLDAINEINSYFASDLMVDKVRSIVAQLEELEDSVKVDDIRSRLKTIREDAVRQLKDRQDLFVDGENIIRLGKHQFSVNAQALDLTTVIREGRFYLHLTGTDFFEQISDERLLATQSVWDQDVVSENRRVYRAEYLAYRLFDDLTSRATDAANGELPELSELRTLAVDELQPIVARYMGPRYSEGYVKGVHDHDAALILSNLIALDEQIGLLRHSPEARALGILFWNHCCPKAARKQLLARCRGYGAVVEAFADALDPDDHRDSLRLLIQEFVEQTELFGDELVVPATRYLFDVLSRHQGQLAASERAARIANEFERHLNASGFQDIYSKTLQSLRTDVAARYEILRDWAEAFIRQREDADDRLHVDEVASLLISKGMMGEQNVVAADVRREIDGLSGTHPRIDGGRYHLDFNEFMERLQDFHDHTVPQFEQFVDVKKQIVDEARDEMRVEEFRPRVLTSFVRNRLLDEVYLPVIGDNLAKQIGAAGDDKRTDRMGLLLLVSPPGYGKTTLMEYIANRLGIIFMKINGPAIGHAVTSLDPQAAPNASAREEIEKLNLAFEMGDNVMIYVDDIQHCHPEFLQKFISLCDAQRRIEGVYRGRTRTYDFRGRKVAVVMAGNPYTESGEKFQIPDMLSNRADIYNLGEMVGDNAEAFEMSYLENSLTSNPVLNKLASRSQKDVYSVIELAQHGRREGIEFEGNYALEELDEMVATMQKLCRVRDVILRVNQQYIRSAAQADEYRTEPAFKLQGSYRNMNRIAEKVLPIMNDAELQQLIVMNYENDAQTLTSDAEANLLKFKELMGILSEAELQRWNDIKKAFQRNNRLRGVDSQDKIGQVVMQLSGFNEGLESIRDAMLNGVAQLDSQAQARAETQSRDADARDEAGREREQRELIQQCAGSLQESLEGIRSAMGEFVPLLAELSEQARAVAARAPQRGETAAATEPAVASAPAAGNAVDILDSQDREIRVINKLPRSFLRVLEQQFELMQSWMKPLMEASQTQSTQLEELRHSLDATLRDYRRLLKRLDQAQGR